MSSVKFNFLYSIIYQILLICVPLITTPYLSKVFGTYGIGVYSYSYSIVNYFCLFALLGINNYGSRSIARGYNSKEERSKSFFEIYYIQLISSITSFIIYCICFIFIFKDFKIIYAFQMILIISSAVDINWFFWGRENFKLTVTRNIIIKIGIVFCILFYVKNSNDLWKYTMIVSIGDLISHIVMWPFLLKEITFISVKFKNCLKHLKKILLLFSPILANSINRNLDKVMLGSMTTMAVTGIYSNADKIINIPVGIITALGTVMLPRMTNLYAQNNFKKANDYIKNSMILSAFLSCGMTFGLIGISKELIPIFLGNEFLESQVVVILLSLTIVFVSWSNVIRNQYIIPNGKDKIYIYAILGGAIINIILNLILITKYQYIGACISTIFSEFFIAIYQSLKVSDELEIKEYFKYYVPFIMNGLIMIILIRMVSKFIPFNYFGLMIEIIFGALCYIILSYIYIYIFKNDIIKKLIKCK